MSGTVELHRVLRTTPEKLYRAFLEPGALAQWIPPYGFYATVHALDAKVGGTFRMSFTHFGSGQSHSFGGRYLELEPNAFLRYTDAFDDPNLPGEIEVQVRIAAATAGPTAGSSLRIVQTGIPDVIPLDACYLGWQESLARLALLVEPEIPI